MSVRIYVMTHKAFEVPKDTMYVPVHVGRALKKAPEDSEVWNYLGDDTGDEISKENIYYSELTGLYWVWKNIKDVDYVGTCHYRRYLLNAQGYPFTESELLPLLDSYDLITTKTLQLNFSYYYGFGENHKIRYLDAVAEVLRERYPDYYKTYEELVHEKHTYFGNMMICSKALYDEYMEWLFSIFFEAQKKMLIEEEDDYHRRIFGFISEFLLFVWVRHKKLSVYECMVGMLGEKAETAEVKQKLADYFVRGDYEGAKQFFLESRERRPDILMEASDVTGELHLCMQVIAIAGLEQQAYGANLLEHMRDFAELMHYCSELNRYTIAKLHGEEDEELRRWLEDAGATDVAFSVSQKMFEGK